ncbi:DUF6249 domain-containing protein [Thalassotalea sp. G2M2-11]|uniref:DUF6249 domain-containing protein n=1 Tax=Thalassotalea sp. G2M2-11 TaxID=2787627 RepID=UPI0019CFDC87|nr:DUF6249 domain-containing protein [Thalassotalea sp. G2M2-11]
MNALWIPIAILISFTIVILAIVFFNHKNKNELQTTIRQILEKEGEITPEILNGLTPLKKGKILDLKRSLVLISLSIACLLAGLILGHTKIFLAIAVFPLMLGIALFISWKVETKHESNNESNVSVS